MVKRNCNETLYNYISLEKERYYIADEAFLSPGWGVWVPGNTYSRFIYIGTI